MFLKHLFQLRMLLLAPLCMVCATASAVEIFPVIKDPSTDFDASDGFNSPVLGRPWSFADPGSSFGIDTNGVVAGNNVTVLTQFAGEVTGNGGTGFVLMSLSNGENDLSGNGDAVDDETRNNGGDTEVDPPNTVPVSSVIETVNGAGMKLENGNVVRLSMWMRSDPSSPLTSSPQVEPLLKFEMWKEYGSLTQDTDPGLIAPQWGDKIFDQQQNGTQVLSLISSYPEKDRVQWVDLDLDGQIGEDPLADDDGRIDTITTDAWTLVSTTYEIKDLWWFGIFDNNTANPPDTSVIGALEEVRATMVFGDWTSTSGSPNTLGEGNLLVDNILVELFADQATADATAIPNPDPALDEIPALDGDYNVDGIIDGADYTVWKDLLDTGATVMSNDPTPGVIDSTDFDYWVLHFGEVAAGAGSGAGGSAGTVPEPNTLVLLVLGLVFSLVCCRRPVSHI